MERIREQKVIFLAVGSVLWAKSISGKRIYDSEVNPTRNFVIVGDGQGMETSRFARDLKVMNSALINVIL